MKSPAVVSLMQIIWTFNAGLELDSGMYQEFDDFEVTLGDIMRGERATRGKSITDVRLELRLPKSYILAIENGDLSAFRCPEFVPGYIYSYAHYLGLDPSPSVFCFLSRDGLFVTRQNADRVCGHSYENGSCPCLQRCRSKFLGLYVCAF